MQVYQYMSQVHALENLTNKRLKVARLADMNDPFELLAASMDNTLLRQHMTVWRNRMDAQSRVLCFSQSRMKTLMWSHYADKHRGICLGFEIPDEKICTVTYELKRLKLSLQKEFEVKGKLDVETANKLLTTKYQGWSYESEERYLLKETDVKPEGDLEFFYFENHFKLTQVVLGPRSTLSDGALKKHIKQYSNIQVIRTRIAYKSFRVVATPPNPHLLK